nr:hypothetical protein [Providencia rettgeri]
MRRTVCAGRFTVPAGSGWSGGVCCTEPWRLDYGNCITTRKSVRRPGAVWSAAGWRWPPLWRWVNGQSGREVTAYDDKQLSRVFSHAAGLGGE